MLRVDGLDGKVAVVTGAGGGIGSALVETLRAQGAKVAAVDLQPPSLECDLAVAMDVREAGAVDRGFTDIEEELGTVQVLVLNAGIFVIEALSVVIQVFAFQAFRKRVFLMAPVHHHFELMAWSETKIILRFWIIAAACSAIGFTIYQNSL